jgi:hypothetical protein
MDRRNTLKTIGTIGIAGALGIGSSGSVRAERPDTADGGNGNNPGRIGNYDGAKTLTPPDLGGFDHVLVYLAEPLVEGDWSVVENAERFQREIMGRDDEAIEADRRAAETFYEERFGLTFEGDVELFESEESADGSAVLNPFYQDPDVGYNAYVVSGRGMPNNHDDGATNRDEMLAGKVSHRAFADAEELGFPLLSDSDGGVAESYDVFYEEFNGHKRIAKRSVFVVDTDGTIRYAWSTDDPSVQPDFSRIKDTLEAL